MSTTTRASPCNQYDCSCGDFRPSRKSQSICATRNCNHAEDVHYPSPSTSPSTSSPTASHQVVRQETTTQSQLVLASPSKGIHHSAGKLNEVNTKVIVEGKALLVLIQIICEKLLIIGFWLQNGFRQRLQVALEKI